MFSKKSLTVILVTLLVAASCTYGEKPNGRLGRQTTDVEEIERSLKGKKGYYYDKYTCPYSCGDKYPYFLYWLSKKLYYLPLGFPDSCCFWSALYKKKYSPPRTGKLDDGDSVMIEDTDDGSPSAEAMEEMLSGVDEKQLMTDLDEIMNELDSNAEAVDTDVEVTKHFKAIKTCIRDNRSPYGKMHCMFKAIYPIIYYKVLPACYCHYRSNLGCTVEADCGYTYKLDFYHSGYKAYKMCGPCTHGKYHPGFPNVESWNKCTGYCHMAAAYYYKRKLPQQPLPPLPPQP